MATRPRGRPRDLSIDDAILAATRGLIVEVGYAGLSMDAVAARAGVTRPTLYRRYASRGALVAEALLGPVRQYEVPDTGDIAADLRTAYRWAVAEYSGPEGRAALPAVLAEVAASPELAHLIRARVLDPGYAPMLASLQRAQQRGQIRDDVDLALFVDACLGSILARVTLLDRSLDHHFADQLIDLLVAGMAPRPTSGKRTKPRG